MKEEYIDSNGNHIVMWGNEVIAQAIITPKELVKPEIIERLK